MSQSMEYIQNFLDENKPVDFVRYLRIQDIENRMVFNRYFKKHLENIVSAKNVDEDLRKWAQTIINNEFEILDRIEVLEYWNKVESRKVKENLKYSALVQLNNRLKFESKVYEDMNKDESEESKQQVVKHKRPRPFKD